MVRDFKEECERKIVIEGDGSSGNLKPPSETLYKDYFIKAGNGAIVEMIGGPNNDCFLGGTGQAKYLVTEFLPYDCAEWCSIKMGNDIILGFNGKLRHRIYVKHIYYSSVQKILDNTYDTTDGALIKFGHQHTIGNSVLLVGIAKADLLEEYFEIYF